ncbi:MAG: tetratricopeptide repeat protein [Deltaproteobacteria bacterium]|nr:MAG: tetratricopeptide repeat protein [Deltaproteobacteria bacterium]
MSALLLALLFAADVPRIEADLEAWDIEAAARGVDELIQKRPESAEAAYFHGRVLFEQGKYEEAAKAFQRAQERADSSVAALLHRGEDEKLARAAAEETAGDEIFESEHFVVRTRPGKDTLLAPYALKALERAFAGLTKDLGVLPSSRIRVEVYDSARSLAHVSPLTVEQIKASGTIALCKYSRLMITSPKALLRGYPWLDTLSHEFVHYLVTQKGRNSVPIWLQEGLAKFLETRWRGQPGLAVDEMSLALLQDAARRGKLIPFARMHPSIAMLPTQEQAALAFAEVEAAIRLLYQRGGQQALTELVSAMAAGFSDEQAVAQAYGKSFREFEAEWRAEVAKPRAKMASAKNVRPLVARKLVFREDAKGRSEPPQLQPSREQDAADSEGKRSVRVGDILFARRRWGAAAKEYGKARARLSSEMPSVSRRYAFAQVQLGNWPEAEEALRGAVERDPEDEAAQALYAHVLVKRSSWDKARAALEQGIAVDPFDPDLHATYVEVARGLKDKKLEEQERRAYALSTGADPGKGVKDHADE